MPQITAIEKQKRTAGRFNVFVDGQFAFGASDLTIVENSLKIGQVLSPEQVQKIVAKEEFSKLLNLATNFLSYRPRSEKETGDYLITKVAKIHNLKFSQAKQSPLIQLVINKLKKYDYLSDLEFAKWWIASRARSRPKGKIILKFELRKKGVADDIINTVTEGLTNEGDLAKKLVARKLERWQNLPSLEFKKKVYQHLSSRGFDFETIAQTVAFFNKKR